MLTLPSEYTTILTSFTRLFSKRVWKYAQTLLIGAILTPGQRTVAAVLRREGISHAGDATMPEFLGSN